MNPKLFKAVLTLAAALAVNAGLLIPPTSASAASTCVLGTPTISAKTLVIGVHHEKTETVKVKVTSCTPTAANDLKVTWWFTQQEEGDPIARLSRVYNGDNTYTYTGSHTFYPSDLDNVWAGVAWETTLAKTRGSDVHVSPISTRTVPDFEILRASRLTISVFLARGYGSVFNKGDHLEIYPWLQRASWNSLKYLDYNKAVSLQFRTRTGSYKTIQTSADSPFFVNATVDGCYRFVRKGNTTTSASRSKGDCVDVK